MLTGYLGNTALFNHEISIIADCFCAYSCPLNFRSCDSTFGLGASREDELGWFSSSNNIGGTKELVNSDFKFSCPESNSVESLRECPWTSDKADSSVSFVNGPAILNGEDGYTPKEKVSFEASTWF